MRRVAKPLRRRRRAAGNDDARIGLSFSYCCMRHYYSCSPHTHESRRHVARPLPGPRLGAARPQPARPRRAATERRPRATGTRFALPKLHAHANSALSQTRTQRQRLLSISSLKKSSASWSEGMLVLAAMLSVTSQPTAGTRMRTHARTRSLSASATGGFKEVSCGPL
jgi:hypothetical protein